MVHYNITIKGKVQGVYFRASALKRARDLSLAGTVKNEFDGSVFIEVEGNKNQIEPFLKWCYVGPTLSKVTEVKITQSSLKNYKEFKILETEN